MESLMEEMEKINKRNKSIIENANITDPSYAQFRELVMNMYNYLDNIMIAILEKEDKYTPN